jgi:hypothetical protein
MGIPRPRVTPTAMPVFEPSFWWSPYSQPIIHSKTDEKGRQNIPEDRAVDRIKSSEDEIVDGASPPRLRLDDFIRVRVTIFTISVAADCEVVLVLVLVEKVELDGGVVVLEDDLPISFDQTRDTYEVGVSLVVVTELDEVDTVVLDDAVRVVAELKASYFVVGDVNT